MNKEELEKMFDEKFYQKGMGSLEIAKLAQQKLFIFNEIIPEVLNSVTAGIKMSMLEWNNGGNKYKKQLNQKAKELYGIIEL